MNPFRILTAALLTAAACSNILTSNRSADVETMYARWQARHVASYDYEFDQGGFFNECPRPVHAYVHADVVDSATVLATGQPVPGGLLACVPTIDGLFRSALGAAHNGALTRIRYDATLSFPADIDIAGPPDASGWLQASKLMHLIKKP